MDISAPAFFLADRSLWTIRVTSVRMRREDRSSISSHPLADLGGKPIVGLRHLRPPSLFSSFVRATRPFLRPGLRCSGHRAQGPSRLAALRGHPQGLALTVPSTVPPSSRLGRHRTHPYAFEFALLAENGPGDPRQLIGERDRQHVVVQSLFGGVDPRLESIALPILYPDQHDPSRLYEQRAQVAITAPRYRTEDRAVSCRDLLW